MKTFNFAHALQAALIAAAIGGASTAALADIKDYRFELVDKTVQAGPDKVITVRLMNTKTGKPVPDAVIFATRLDMAPDGMQEMATKIVPCSGRGAGQLQVQGDVRNGGALAAFARRQGSGRDRHRREQARHHGAEMTRAVLISVAAALIAAAGIGFVAGAQRPLVPGIAIVTPAVAEGNSAPIYFQDPDGKPAYSLTPRKTGDGRDYRGVSVGADVSFDEAAPDTLSPATTSAGGTTERKIKYYRNPMGLPDTSPTPKKEFDGDGLHPGL